MSKIWTFLMVALSAADSNKWLLLIENRLEGQTTEDHTSSDYQLLGPIRQQQRRLTVPQVTEMVARYQGGATVYELSAEFGCHRTTVAARLMNVGIAIRYQSPTSEAIDSMARLYASGISLLEVSRKLGFCANTVRTCPQSRQEKTHRRTEPNHMDRSKRTGRLTLRSISLTVDCEKLELRKDQLEA
jgi:transposase-like protein